jgi:hypothetical protein
MLNSKKAQLSTQHTCFAGRFAKTSVTTLQPIAATLILAHREKPGATIPQRADRAGGRSLEFSSVDISFQEKCSVIFSGVAVDAIRRVFLNRQEIFESTFTRFHSHIFIHLLQNMRLYSPRNSPTPAPGIRLDGCLKSHSALSYFAEITSPLLLRHFFSPIPFFPTINSFTST